MKVTLEFIRQWAEQVQADAERRGEPSVAGYRGSSDRCPVAGAVRGQLGAARVSVTYAESDGMGVEITAHDEAGAVIGAGYADELVLRFILDIDDAKFETGEAVSAEEVIALCDRIAAWTPPA